MSEHNPLTFEELEDRVDGLVWLITHPQENGYDHVPTWSKPHAAPSDLLPALLYFVERNPFIGYRIRSFRVKRGGSGYTYVNP